MRKWHQVKSYLVHWLYAINEHSLHEPFAFDLYQQVIQPVSAGDHDPAIEKLRKKYVDSTTPFEPVGGGAPSTFPNRTLRQTAYSGSTRPNHALILQQLVRFTKSTQILELGTSMGFTTRYLAAVPGVEVCTLEGDPLLCKQARNQFAGTDNITLVHGDIDQVLTPTLEKLKTIDFAYIDANHRYAPTWDYFEKLLPYCHQHSVLVFDDIHWSAEMSRAWKDIQAHPRVSLSFDLYHMGMVFFKPLRNKYAYLLSLN